MKGGDGTARSVERKSRQERVREEGIREGETSHQERERVERILRRARWYRGDKGM